MLKLRAKCEDIVADIIEIEEDICYIQNSLQNPNVSAADVKILTENLEILRSVRKSAIKELKDDFYYDYGA